MGTKSKTAVAADYQAYAEQQRALGLGLEAAGDHQGAEHYFGAARHYEDKARLTLAAGGRAPQIAMGEVTSGHGNVIAWKPTNTLRDPNQVALDASAERKQLLLGPELDVCALALDAAASIEANDSLEKMLAHQLALAHKLAFDFANRSSRQTDPTVATKFLNLSVRLMDTFQRGVLTVQKLRSGNSQTVTVQHIHVHGGQTMVAGTLQTGGPAGD